MLFRLDAQAVAYTELHEWFSEARLLAHLPGRWSRW